MAGKLEHGFLGESILRSPLAGWGFSSVVEHLSSMGEALGSNPSTADPINGAIGMTQLVDCLPSKHDALNSNPSTAENKYINSLNLHYC